MDPAQAVYIHTWPVHYYTHAHVSVNDEHKGGFVRGTRTY